MNLPTHLAKHLREVHFGKNWTSVNLKDQLAGLTFAEANTKIKSFNTIFTLVVHTNYYVKALIRVLNNQPLNAKDEWSFILPDVHSDQGWNALVAEVWKDAEDAALLIEQLPESKIWEDFTDAKYGNYYRNIQGTIEHMHYHLGQIVFLRKMIKEGLHE